jgi:hypothetical protein
MLEMVAGRWDYGQQARNTEVPLAVTVQRFVGATLAPLAGPAERFAAGSWVTQVLKWHLKFLKMIQKFGCMWDYFKFSKFRKFCVTAEFLYKSQKL